MYSTEGTWRDVAYGWHRRYVSTGAGTANNVCADAGQLIVDAGAMYFTTRAGAASTSRPEKGTSRQMLMKRSSPHALDLCTSPQELVRRTQRALTRRNRFRDVHNADAEATYPAQADAT